MRLFNLMKNIGGTVILSFFLFSVFSTIAMAETTPPSTGPDCTKEYCALTTIPGITEANKPADPIKVIKDIYGTSIGIGAMLAVIMIIWAGVEYATTESITGHSDAKEKWQGALFGLILLLSSYIILRTININLVDIRLDLSKPIKGQAVDVNELQKALDTLTTTADNLKNTQTSITSLDQQKQTKETALAKLVSQGKGDSAEATTIKSEIELMQNELTQLQKTKTDQETALQKSQQELSQTTADSTKAYCYTASNRTSTRESCYTTIDKCMSDYINEGSPTKTACRTLSAAESQTKYTYCISYSVVGLQGKTTMIQVPKKECSSTPSRCQALRTSLTSSNGSKKANDPGFITNIGSCTPEIKTS